MLEFNVQNLPDEIYTVHMRPPTGITTQTSWDQKVYKKRDSV
ncbi:MAG: hypothetical protein AAGA10_28460 [Bacteroidota bacterium]